MAKPNGAVIWEGPSRINGEPLVVIVTGLSKASDNAKTGDMLQTWVLLRDVKPTQAVATGEDVAICGGCPHRGAKDRKRSCYVQVGQAPRQIWEAYKRGSYPKVSPEGLGSARAVRVGSYGDPAAVPVEVWEGLLVGSVAHTGYTHQWKAKRLVSDRLMAICQASVDTPSDLAAARSKGYGTFRVLRKLDVLGDSEVHCPADRGLTDCASCGLCDGRKGVNVAIPAHGFGAKNADEIGS